jgi:nucleoside-diphosphate-sugar epimerase
VSEQGRRSETRSDAAADAAASLRPWDLEGDANGVFHVGTAIETSIGALCAMIQRFTRTNATPIFEPARAGEQRRSSLDARRLTAQTGWRAATSLADGLAATVAFFAPHIAATERSRVTQRFCRTG